MFTRGDRPQFSAGRIVQGKGNLGLVIRLGSALPAWKDQVRRGQPRAEVKGDAALVNRVRERLQGNRLGRARCGIRGAADKKTIAGIGLQLGQACDRLQRARNLPAREPGLGSWIEQEIRKAGIRPASGPHSRLAAARDDTGNDKLISLSRLMGRRTQSHPAAMAVYPGSQNLDSRTRAAKAADTVALGPRCAGRVNLAVKTKLQQLGAKDRVYDEILRGIDKYRLRQHHAEDHRAMVGKHRRQLRNTGVHRKHAARRIVHQEVNQLMAFRAGKACSGPCCTLPGAYPQVGPGVIQRALENNVLRRVVLIIEISQQDLPRIGVSGKKLVNDVPVFPIARLVP